MSIAEEQRANFQLQSMEMQLRGNENCCAALKRHLRSEVAAAKKQKHCLKTGKYYQLKNKGPIFS